MEWLQSGMDKVKRLWKHMKGSARLRWTLILIPGISALIGYAIYYQNKESSLTFLYVIFDALKVYTGSFEASLDGVLSIRAQGRMAEYYLMCICLEIGRWGGLFIAGTFLFGFLREIYERMDAGRKARNEQMIAVHGSEHYKLLLRKAFGKAAIVGDFPEKFKARRHILAFDSDQQLLEYLGAHFAEFPGMNDAGNKGKKGDVRIHLCLESSAHAKYSNAGFVVNNIAEDCARLYWKQHYIHRHGGKTEKKIILIGFGHYGQALLSQALMVNVFARPPHMEYHIFGESSSYCRLHRGIDRFASVNAEDETKDSVYFHDDGWENHLSLLASADRVILCHDADEENIRILSMLDEEIRHTPIHIRSRNVKMLKALYSEQKIEEDDSQADLCVFGTDQRLYTRELLLDEALLETAKMVHAYYVRHGSIAQCENCKGVAALKNCVRNCPHFADNWNKLGIFLQRSNIYAADHMDVKVREVLERDCSVTEEALRDYGKKMEACIRQKCVEPYLELEHRRWMRYYYFCGWEYADIPKKDPVAKRHPLLIPYHDLDEGQKMKDMDSYTLLREFQLQALKM